MRKLTATLGTLGIAAGCLVGASTAAAPAQAASCSFSNVTMTSHVDAYNVSCSWIQGKLTSSGKWVYGNRAARGIWTTMSACYANVANQRVDYAV